MRQEFWPLYQKQEGKKVGECGRIFMSDSQDMVQAKNTFYDDTSEPILFFLHLSPGPEHISSGIPAIFRHLFKPDNVFFFLQNYWFEGCIRQGEGALEMKDDSGRFFGSVLQIPQA